ncbi:hypothetical protein M2650_13165 [Luteimonas sp. SX5]|uniref:Uncharacterized protein n=1 Tax=Luteimonas galliterrae TaxID=2940486 RepID=A0ABT0ML14_9GAMM|nr:hypothetical protein [Luteimonas galliterrae]MCL1635572.1 hypothetical protein [Luteimonas galliterrae]
MARRKNKLFVLAILFATTTSAAVGRPNEYSELWLLIDKIGRGMPLRKDKYEAIINSQLYLRDSDEYGAEWSSGPIPLQRTLGISETSLALDASGRFGPRSGVAIKIVGACVTTMDVESVFGSIKIIHSPRGHSLEEATIYRASREWGYVDFSFKEIAPDCLATIILSGKNRPD